jgi:hypothetical protein
MAEAKNKFLLLFVVDAASSRVKVIGLSIKTLNPYSKAGAVVNEITIHSGSLLSVTIHDKTIT